MNPHTPGPWHIYKDAVTYTNVRDHHDGVIAIMSTMNEDANARLIASAPDLLLALERLIHPMADDEDLSFARDCIANARGK